MSSKFTAEELKHREPVVLIYVKPGPPMKFFIMGDSVKNEHGHFVSPYGRGFTAEEEKQVAAGTYKRKP